MALQYATERAIDVGPVGRVGQVGRVGRVGLLNAAAFAPDALRRASPKLEKIAMDRRREAAKPAKKNP
jgi:hypothetical protein